MILTQSRELNYFIVESISETIYALLMRYILYDVYFCTIKFDTGDLF
jgi:hypothetical protein